MGMHLPLPRPVEGKTGQPAPGAHLRQGYEVFLGGIEPRHKNHTREGASP